MEDLLQGERRGFGETVCVGVRGGPARQEGSTGMYGGRLTASSEAQRPTCSPGPAHTFLDAQGVNGPVAGIDEAVLGPRGHQGLVHGQAGWPRGVQLPAQLPHEGQPHGPDLGARHSSDPGQGGGPAITDGWTLPTTTTNSRTWAQATGHQEMGPAGESPQERSGNL